ncbi:hypothetical protein MJI12_26585, partial [Salmonella enterica subsp. enterica serovar Kentucky]|nr:hypothetical protein [Salmonella enterica subsp. enterica serovar Kentucky]
QPLPVSIKRTAILLTLGISLHNFPEGIATFVTASSNLELGFGRRPWLLNGVSIDVLFPSQRAQQMTRQTFWHRIKHYAVLAGID